MSWKDCWICSTGIFRRCPLHRAYSTPSPLLSMRWTADRNYIIFFLVLVLLAITESQNQRMAGVRKDLCGSSSPYPLLKHGHLQQAAQDLVQAGFEYLQRRRLHSLLTTGQSVPGLCHPQSEEVLPHVQKELPLLQFVSVAPCPVTGHH